MKQWVRTQSTWMLVEQDECWFSRFAQPAMHAFVQIDTNLRLVERTPQKGEPNQALACYGARCQQTHERYFYFATGQPNSKKTIAMLQALLTVAQQKAKAVLIVIWDRASWHKSQKVKLWVRSHNHKAKQQENGVRLLTYLLPAKSPWLNPMEPIWLHAKRKIVEPDGELSVQLLQQRLCAHFQTTLENASLNISA